MRREDEGMPFLLRYENVAWFDGEIVRILDRRVYPRETTFVECRTHEDVAAAITAMVTQSAGPYTAVGMGMALAAHETRDASVERQRAYLKRAAETLANSRPTTANRYRLIADGCLRAADAAFRDGSAASQAILRTTVDSLNRRYATMQRVGDDLLRYVPQGGTVLTQCFGETIVGTLIRAARRESVTFRAFCAETRPYLQGARLTASCFADAGVDTTVITDNAVALTMQREHVDLFTSAADVIARDGHIANKIGTWQMAIVARHLGVPYYVTGIPDEGKRSADDIVIEYRDPDDVLSCHGIRHTAPGVKGLYPSFDITPPELITGVVTDRGTFAPDRLDDYFSKPAERFY